MTHDEPNISVDIFCDASGKKWTAELREHPLDGGPGVVVWRREGMRSDYNATSAMEAARQRLLKKAKARREGRL